MWTPESSMETQYCYAFSLHVHALCLNFAELAIEKQLNTLMELVEGILHLFLCLPVKWINKLSLKPDYGLKSFHAKRADGASWTHHGPQSE